jgi:predicted alpha/beta superfamily hydrolase
MSLRTMFKIVRIAIFSFASIAHGGDLPANGTVSAEPLSVARAYQYDLTSRINNLKYRIMVSTPWNAEPGKHYAVFYILDGNLYFLSAAATTLESSQDLVGSIVVGVGYPTDDRNEIARRRAFDLTLPGNRTKIGQYPAGGGDDFVHVLLEEIKPLVESHYQVDPERQIIYGKSLGGLLVLHLLFIHPEAFQTYIAASPSIWWDNRSVLSDENRFWQRIKTINLRLRVLITSAGNEQYFGPDPKLREEDKGGMIDSASDLANRLATYNPQNLSVTYAIFPGEDHDSASLASLGRALYFALKP